MLGEPLPLGERDSRALCDMRAVSVDVTLVSGDGVSALEAEEVGEGVTVRVTNTLDEGDGVKTELGVRDPVTDALAVKTGLGVRDPVTDALAVDSTVAVKHVLADMLAVKEFEGRVVGDA